MDVVDFKTELKYRLKTIRPHNESGEQIALRCPFCGDSAKNMNSTHFYIKIGMRNPDEPVLFHCFKCDISGVLTPSVMRTLDIYDMKLSSSLLSHNNRTVGKMQKELGIVNNSFEFKVPKGDKNNSNHVMKKKYLESRLGVELSFKELQELKVVVSLGDFLTKNKIENLTAGKEKVMSLHEDYMGFLTARNEFINFRKVNEKSKFKRYENYKVVNTLDNTRKFYVIPTEVDLLSNDELEINIAEGPITILGVYYHIFGKDMRNRVFVAACGSGYAAIIKYFIKMGMFGNVTINIWSDEDHSPYFYKNTIEELSPWVNKFNLYYNDLSNDFGVTKDKIKVKRRKL